ncbi:hypothetical protein ACH5RR_036386 [Cinchona calisaya]|uniref:Protein kinase domain-containing protein n=1 Tax=Cinchona calisaya TaxID=153742 RepID=A0ABD2Y682_9GENT
MARRTAEKLVFLGNGLQEYELEDLLSSDAEVLAKGTFGTTYKTNLELRSIKKTVAVKRLKVDRLSEGEFRENIEELGKMVHENLLPIRAYCSTDSERLLIYDYMNAGSLSFFLHGKTESKIGQGREELGQGRLAFSQKQFVLSSILGKSAGNGVGTKAPLTWNVRCSIAYGVARGIAYIHTKGSDICHGNIRSSNVLLTNSFDACISDFCIYKLFPPTCKLNLIVGYRAPEVTDPNEVSQKSDVYSFGVLLLELLTGKVPLSVLHGGVDLPKWVRAMFQEKPIIDLFDAMLPKYENNGEQMVQLLQLAVCCTFENPSKRPSIAAATDRIEHICRFKQ